MSLEIPARGPLRVSLWDVLDSESFGPVGRMHCTRVWWRDVHEFARRWHYSGHGANLLWCYGLWDGDVLVSVVGYNLPTREAQGIVFGPELAASVVHMGKLVSADDAPRNTESRLIAASLRMLRADVPHARAVLSFASQDEGHIGYVYQATNALYTGVTIPDRYYLAPDGTKHGSRHMTHAQARAAGWTIVPSAPKHRYVYLLGSKSERRAARRLLRLPVLPYPKC